MKLKLFEVESSAIWWVASHDEHGVLSLIQDDLYDRDYSDSEVDAMLSEIDVKELSKYEAEAIGVASPPDGELKSLWFCFISNRRECVLGTSLDEDPVDMGGVEELDFDCE